MITLSGQRFVGASQAGETRGERSERVNHAIKQGVRPFSACTVRMKMVETRRILGATRDD
jgi:hypothetical protein